MTMVLREEGEEGGGLGDFGPESPTRLTSSSLVRGRAGSLVSAREASLCVLGESWPLRRLCLCLRDGGPPAAPIPVT